MLNKISQSQRDKCHAIPPNTRSLVKLKGTEERSGGCQRLGWGCKGCGAFTGYGVSVLPGERALELGYIHTM